MRWGLFFVIVMFCACVARTCADTPPLLAKAINHWSEGRLDLAFTLTTRGLQDDQSTKYVRVERYDPSLPDDQRWRLLEVNGKPPTEEERKTVETKRNRKPRKRGGTTPSSYLDLENARLVRETERTAHFEVGIKPGASRFITLDKIVVHISVDKAAETIDHVSATLNEPVRIALGLAKITDVDLDVHFEEPEDGPPPASEVTSGSSARVTMSKFGDPVEFTWSDFKEVPTYHAPGQVIENQSVTLPARSSDKASSAP